MEHYSTEISKENVNREKAEETDDNCVDREKISDMNEKLKVIMTSNEFKIDWSLFYDLFINKNENNSKILEIDGKTLTANRKLKNSTSQLLSTNNEIEKLETDEELGLPTLKKIKYSKDTNIETCRNSNFQNMNVENISKCINDEQLEVKMNSGSKEEKSLNYDPILSKTNVIPFNSFDMLNSTCLTAFSAPSRSEDMSGLSSCTSLPGSSGSFSLSCTPSFSGSFNEVVNNIDPSIKKEHLSNYTVCSNEQMCVPITKSNDNSKINQDLKVLPLEECDVIEDLLKTIPSENGNEDSQTENSECFIKKINFVNPDIMYNIRLHEHYTKMNILAQQISICNNDVQLLDECKKLKPIPRFKNKLQTFTEEERINLSKGLPKWEYNVGTDDWNEIMVELSAVFSAHAGFNMVDNECKNVLSNVTVEYIKKLAVVMKENCNIQLGSPSNSIDDSILNSLQEVGIEGGINDLIAHYENDVFGRRRKLYEKCVYLQTIIDEYVERMSLHNKVINKNAAEEDREKEKFSELKNSFINTEIGQIQRVNNNTNDQETVENTETSAMDSHISKPIKVGDHSCFKYSSIGFDIRNIKYLDAMEHLREGELFYDSESNFESEENLTLLNGSVTNKRKRSHSPKIKKIDNSLLKFYKVLKDFNDELIHYNKFVIENNVLLNSTVLIQSEEDYASQPTPDQTEHVHEQFAEDENNSIENNIYDISAISTDDTYDLNILRLDNYEDFN